ncbi:hypothetical protein B0H11DRAFT_2262674 [Mycena galericulata]|nr:hypothetical protein B0H11DRAFT_2262674 [Mycena galericulata]
MSRDSGDVLAAHAAADANSRRWDVCGWAGAFNIPSSPSFTGTSVLAIKFKDGVMIAAENVASRRVATHVAVGVMLQSCAYAELHPFRVREFAPHAACAALCSGSVTPGPDTRRARTARREFAKRATCAAGSMPHRLAHPLTALRPGGPLVRCVRVRVPPSLHLIHHLHLERQCADCTLDSAQSQPGPRNRAARHLCPYLLFGGTHSIDMDPENAILAPPRPTSDVRDLGHTNAHLPPLIAQRAQAPSVPHVKMSAGVASK